MRRHQPQNLEDRAFCNLGRPTGYCRCVGRGRITRTSSKFCLLALHIDLSPQQVQHQLVKSVHPEGRFERSAVTKTCKVPTCERSSGEAESLGNVSIAKTSKTGAFFCRVRTASLSKMTVFDGPQATQLTRCHPGSLSHPVFLFLAQPHDDVQVPHCKAQISTMCGVNDTDLCVAICRFSQVVFVTLNKITRNLLFYFQ